MKAHTHRAELVIDLEGPQGNAFAVIGSCRKIMRQLGADEEYCKWFFDEARATGSYDALLKHCKRFLNIIDSSLTQEGMEDDGGDGDVPMPGA